VIAPTTDRHGSAAPQTRVKRTSDLRILARPAFWHRLANPYTWLLYSHMIAADGVVVEDYHWKRLVRRRYDVLHLHWPEGHLNEVDRALAFRRSLSALGLLRWARWRGTKIVWTIHNLRSHERLHPALEHWFWAEFLRCLDGYISLSHTGQEAALARFPQLRGVPGFVVPAGHYREAYVGKVTKTASRLQLGIDPQSKVLAFLGQVRPYKNVPRLVNAFRALTDPSLVLLVAGEPKSLKLAAELHAAAGDDPRVRLHLGWIPDEQILSYLAAADLVLLPYNEVLNSGSALLALSFDRPVLVPEMGSLPELQELAGQEWVRTYTGAITPGHLREAVDWALGAARSQQAPLEGLQWDRIAADTLAAYKTVLSQVSA
jgi:beta-1,4-mannosyltransferase